MYRMLPCSEAPALHPKKAFDNGGYHHQENTGPKPRSGYLRSIRIPAVPFLVNFDSAYQPDHRADGIHQVTTRVKIAFDLGGRRIDAAVAVRRALLGCFLAGLGDKATKGWEFKPLLHT
jgi:hypothetical protein